MKILHLTLYRRWFDEIAAGKKKIEYRKITPYWASRMDGKTFDEIHFRNGYGHHRPFMRVEFKKIVKNNKYYKIHLGNILEIINNH